jgi:16S rRNA U516 pseudouridylate synthase RsuA-like enzyme
MAVMSDGNADTIAVVDRLLAAGLSLERAEEYLRGGRVEVNGELVSDPSRRSRQAQVWSQRVPSSSTSPQKTSSFSVTA